MEGIIIIGGDKRQLYLKNIFLEKGYICEWVNSEKDSFVLNNISEFDVIMLPLPISKDKMHIYSDNSSFLLKTKDVLKNIGKDQILLAGSIDKLLKAYLIEKEIQYFDYYSSEAFVLYNAYLTAQGALRLLLENTDELLNGKKVLVTGYGRVAKALSETLKKNEADVYVAARNIFQLQEAECRGNKTLRLSDISNRLFMFDYIINTVPAEIFFKDGIKRFRGKYFELASAPYGVASECFSERQRDYINGSSLPGKYLPLSSAKKIADITSEYINKRKGGDQ